MQTEEKWADVPGYAGLYQVSDLGNARTRLRTGPGNNITDTWKPLAPVKNPVSGYYQLTLYKNGRSHTRRFHRVQYEAFFGVIPHGVVIRHRDDNVENRMLYNLLPGTNQDNSDDAQANGLIPRGSQRLTSKLTEEKVAEIKRRIAAGDLQKQIAKDYGVDRSLIYLIRKGVKWRHVAA